MQKRSSAAAIAGLGIVAALAACGGGAAAALQDGQSPQPASPTNSQPATPTVNVVIYLIDTLRADRIGAYGYSKPTTPTIDALAKEGVLFERHSAAAPWTLPSITSLQTSTMPGEHGVLMDGHRITSAVTTLAERMHALGYMTAAFYANPYAGPVSGLQRGYDVSQMLRTRDAFNLGPWLDQNKSKPFYLYVHTMEVHDPYQTPQPHVAPFGQVSADECKRLGDTMKSYRELTRADFDAKRPLGTTDNTVLQDSKLKAMNDARATVNVLYDGSVHWADANLGRVIAQLKSKNLWDNTLFILTADHGEEMGEHGGWQHDQSAYEELLHTPLIVKFPKGEFAGRRVKDVAASIDVLPTVLDYLKRGDVIGAARGQSLMPRIASAGGSAPPARHVSLRWNQKKYYKPWKQSRGDINAVVREDNWKAILNVQSDTLELYDLGSDPGETKNLAAADAPRAARFRKLAADFLRVCVSNNKGGQDAGLNSIDAESQRILQQIGYLGDPTQAEPDGKNPAAPAASQPTSSPASRPRP